MEGYQQDFIQFALKREVLKFGEFKLKSGRTSPYFFNAGLFSQGSDHVQVGQAYSQTLLASGIDFDLIFGPAYKGIPIGISTACALAQQDKDCGVVFNRKEAKTHGEGGSLVGAELKGKVVIVDDVITAGTAIREVIEIVKQSDAELVGVVVALDRQEKGQGELSAIQEIEQEQGIPVKSIVNLDQLIGYADKNVELAEQVERIKAYRNEYGISV